MTKDTPAARIRSYLEREELSVADLAAAAETTEEQLEAILGGARVPAGLGWRLATAMRCSVVWMWHKEKNPANL